MILYVRQIFSAPPLISYEAVCQRKKMRKRKPNLFPFRMIFFIFHCTPFITPHPSYRQVVENPSDIWRVGHPHGLRRPRHDSGGRSLRSSRFPTSSQTYACAEAKGPPENCSCPKIKFGRGPGGMPWLGRQVFHIQVSFIFSHRNVIPARCWPWVITIKSPPIKTVCPIKYPSSLGSLASTIWEW